MKAIVCEKYGPPEVLELKEIERPAPRDGEVLVKVIASSINSWDWDLLRGKPFLTRLGSPFRPQYKILGCDIAGRIEAVGTNVERLKPGDEVLGDISGCGWGGLAEYVCATESILAKKPEKMTFQEAAAIPQSGVIALQSIRDNRSLNNGDRVLINGAGGCVGPFAVQLAKVSGAEVTAVDCGEKLDMLRSIGADHLIDYTREDFTESGKQYELIIDLVASRSVSEYRQAIAQNGVGVLVGGSTGAILKAQLRGATGGAKIMLLMHRPNNADLETMNDFFEAGSVLPVIDSCFKLDEVPEAFRYFGEGRPKGKVVIAVDDTERF